MDFRLTPRSMTLNDLELLFACVGRNPHKRTSWKLVGN